MNDSRVMGFRPDHTSMTTFEIVDGALKIVERGPEAATQVL
jgi:hypothetical protein